MSDVKESLKVVTTNLRKAQNAMFSSKLDEAYALLDELAPALEQAQALDAGNVQVKNATNQVAKLRKDLDKRTGRATESSPSSSQQLPPKPVAKAASDSQQVRADKSWSALAGNIMWSEEMAAEELG